MKLFFRLLLVILCVAALEKPPAMAVSSRSHALSIWETPSLPHDFTCLPYADPAAPKGGVLRLGVLGSFDSFNPFSPRGRPAAYLINTYGTLAERSKDESNAYYGNIAAEFELPPDRSYMIAHLRPEARFHDGTPVTAEDVVFSFYALTEKATPTYRQYYEQVTKAEAVSPLAVKFTFAAKENRELPLIVSQLPVLPKHWWQGRDIGEPNLEPMPGTGPYRLHEHVPGVRLVYRRTPDWWGDKLNINKGRYNFDEIRIDYYRDATVMREAFFAGELDFFRENTIKDWMNSYNVPPVLTGKIIRLEVADKTPHGMTGLFMNTRRPVFADARVRAALNLAFDYEWINKTMFYGAYTRCTSYFSGADFAAPDLPGPDELKILAGWGDKIPPELLGPIPRPEISDGSGDIRPRISRALALLKEAGWNLHDGKLLNGRGEQMHFTVILFRKTFQRMLLPFQRNLRRMGIEMDIQLIDQAQYINRVRSRNYDMIHATIRQSESPGNEQRYFWSSASAKDEAGKNYSGISDPLVDEAIELLIASASYEDLKTHAALLDRLLLHGQYVIPGWYFDVSRLAWWGGKITPPKRHPRYGFDLSTWHRPTAAE